MVKLCESTNVCTSDINRKFTNSVVHKMTIDLGPNTADRDTYYQCVKTTSVQSSHVTPDAVHDHLMKANKVC